MSPNISRNIGHPGLWPSVRAHAETGTGRYFNRLAEARANDQACDPQARRRLRELSEQLTGV